MNHTELIAGRRLVQAFIMADLRMIALLREVRVATPAGAWRVENLPPLELQRARIIVSKRRFANPHVNTEAGEVTRWPYILLGWHDMDIQEEDTFVVEDREFRVKGIELNRQIRTQAALEMTQDLTPSTTTEEF